MKEKTLGIKPIEQLILSNGLYDSEVVRHFATWPKTLVMTYPYAWLNGYYNPPGQGIPKKYGQFDNTVEVRSEIVGLLGELLNLVPDLHIATVELPTHYNVHPTITDFPQIRRLSQAIISASDVRWMPGLDFRALWQGTVQDEEVIYTEEQEAGLPVELLFAQQKGQQCVVLAPKWLLQSPLYPSRLVTGQHVRLDTGIIPITQALASWDPGRDAIEIGVGVNETEYYQFLTDPVWVERRRRAANDLAQQSLARIRQGALSFFLS